MAPLSSTQCWILAHYQINKYYYYYILQLVVQLLWWRAQVTMVTLWCDGELKLPWLYSLLLSMRSSFLPFSNQAQMWHITRHSWYWRGLGSLQKEMAFNHSYDICQTVQRLHFNVVKKKKKAHTCFCKNIMPCIFWIHTRSCDRFVAPLDCIQAWLSHKVQQGRHLTDGTTIKTTTIICYKWFKQHTIYFNVRCFKSAMTWLTWLLGGVNISGRYITFKTPWPQYARIDGIA